MLPRKARIARSRCLVDFELFSQIVNGRREQLHGIVDQSGLQLCTNIIRLAPIWQYTIIYCSNLFRVSNYLVHYIINDYTFYFNYILADPTAMFQISEL